MGNSISAKVSIIRKEKSYTISKLSTLTGVSVSYICDIEHGRKNPSITTLIKFAEALDVSVSELLAQE